MAVPETEELRIALVLNGGVSLAVWIGGVTRELARLVARQSPYDHLLKVVGYDPRIDVIAGTSAGGVNGAYLAMALTHLPLDQLDAGMTELRSIWVNRAGIGSLIRDPFVSDPPSVLDGDGYYYDALRNAFRALDRSKTSDGSAHGVSRAMDLILTATLLRGKAQNQADDFGSSVADTTHRARFWFSRRERSDKDDFTDERIAEKLAVAARSTSSFPGAFEPSFCPVGNSDPDRPDMGPYVNFETGRFLIDGGVLDNKPLDVALDCIFKQKAYGPARRAMIYVVPDPGVPTTIDTPDDRSETPEILRVLVSSMVEIPLVQSVSGQLEQLRTHNQQVRSKRRTRTLITRHLDANRIDRMSDDLFESYRDERIERALTIIIDGLNAGLSGDPRRRALGLHGRRAMLHKVIYDARDNLNWIPKVAPIDSGGAREREGSGWRWGTTIIGQLARIVYDLLVRLEKLNVGTSSERADRWTKMSVLLARSDALTEEDETFWKDAAGEVNDDWARGSVADSACSEFQGWFKNKLDEWSARIPPEYIATLATHLAQLTGELAHHFSENSGRRAEGLSDQGTASDVDDLRKLFAYLAPGECPCLQRMLAFVVVQEALGDDFWTRQEEEIEFLQLSGNDDELLGNATGTLLAAQKLNGTQLAHFGAFYKSSWRANDWLWGRRDAVSRILRIVLCPSRLKRVAQEGFASDPSSSSSGSSAPEYLAKQFREIVLEFGGKSGIPADQQFVTSEWSKNEPEVLRELEYVARNDEFIPENLPVLIRLLTKCITADILRDELPLLALAIQSDMDAHMAVGVNARRIREDCLRLSDLSNPPKSSSQIRPGLPLDLQTASDLAGACNLGEETWKDEAGTDPATAVTAKALAVTIGTINGDRGVAAVIGRLLSTLRLPSLLFYSGARNLAQRSRTGVAIVAIILGCSLAILFVRACIGPTANVPAWSILVKLAFAATVTSAFIFANRIKRGWLRVVIGVAIGLAALAFVWYITNQVVTLDGWRTIAFAEAAIIIGSLTLSAISIRHKLATWWRRHKLRRELRLSKKCQSSIASDQTSDMAAVISSVP